MPRTYIATPKSKQIIKDANKRQKEGKSVDWDKVFVEVNKTKAKSVSKVIKAINKANNEAKKK